MPRFTLTFRRAALIGALAVLIPAAALAINAVATRNFHEILPNQFYRSAQLSPDELAQRIEQYGIRTVVNLRGAQAPGGWYDEERQVSAAHGVQLIDFQMSASKHLSPERALALVDQMKKAPKPILVHCLSGADRTGLVAIIYLSQVAGMDEETAEAQLSPFFGHFGIPYLTSSFAMDESWEELEPLFGIEGS